MTNAEAIEILKSRYMCATYVDSEYVDSVDIEVIDMAIAALEKQEGKKPVDSRCPNCQSDNVEVWQDGGYVATKFSFCPDCGQKILWEE